MKKRLSALLAALLTVAIFLSLAGCASGNNGKNEDSSDSQNAPASSDSSSWEVTGEKLIVGTMPNNIGAPVYYAYENGLFEEAGLNVEVLLFQNGAAINESLQADEIQIAASGAASIYAMGTGDVQWLGEIDVSVDGMRIYVRPDSPIASAKGYSDYDDVLGSPDTVKGATVLCQLATISQQQVMSWCDLIGVDSNDVEMLNMDYSAAWQAFQSGEADAIAVSPPYNYYCDDAGLVNVCSFCTTNEYDINNGMIARNDIVADNPGDVYAFMEVVYDVMQKFTDDPDLRAEYYLDFYNANGKDYTAEQVALEMEERAYTTKDYMSASDFSFGSGMIGMGEFFYSVGNLTESDLENAYASLNPQFINKLYGLDVPVAARG